MIQTVRSGINAHRFWNWFARAAHGYRNALEALTRGEADARSEMDRLDRRVRSIQGDLTASVALGPDGRCQIVFSGREDGVSSALRAARKLPGWDVGYGDIQRLPPRAAPAAVRPRTSGRKVRRSVRKAFVPG